MTFLEWLLTVLVIIELIEMTSLAWSSRKTQKDIEALVHDPNFGGSILSNGVHGFIKALAEDKEKQQAFFGLIQIMGQAALEGARGSAAVKPVKLKGWAKIFEPLVNSPEIQQMAAEKLGSMMKTAGEAGAKKAAETVTEGWG